MAGKSDRVAVAAALAAVLLAAGCAPSGNGADGGAPSGAPSDPSERAESPAGRQKVGGGLNGSIDGFAFRPSVYGDGEVVAAVVDEEEQESAGSEWVGKTITGYEGDSVEAFGRTFTFVEVQAPTSATDNGYVIVQIDRPGAG